MIVVLDTNIWLEQLVLNSNLGSAIRFFLRQRSARLALPEVVRLETQHKLRRRIQDAVDNVAKGARQLLTLFGSMKEVVLPTTTEIEAFVSDPFKRLGVEIIEIPFSFESARASFMKIIRAEAPSDKNQQFKDGVIWADCLRLLDEDDVLLATADTAFYANRQYERGLAENLLAELKGKARQLRIVPFVTEVLKQVESNFCVDEAWLASALQERWRADRGSFLSKPGLEIAGAPAVQTNLFATENPELLYFTYALEIPCNDLTGEGRGNLKLSITGNGTLRPTSREIVETRVDGETLSFTKPDGTDGSMRIGYIVAHGVGGHRTVEHTVRYQIGGAGQQAVAADDPAAGTLV